MATVRKDTDKRTTYLVSGLLTAALLFIEFKYGRWSEMSTLVLIGIIALHVFFAYTWYKVVKTMQDPNNGWRIANIVMAFVCIAAVMGHRAAQVEDKMFRDDVEKNKVENAAP